MIKEARIRSLQEMLDFVKINNTERQYFDKNGNRDIYDKFRDDQQLCQFHTQVHYFFSLHLATKVRVPTDKSDTEAAAEPKSCLKRRQYDVNIQAAKNKIEMNFFSLAKAPRRQKQRENHVRSILNTYNKQQEQDEKDSQKKDPHTGDEGKESTQQGSPDKKEDQEMANEDEGGEEVGF